MLELLTHEEKMHLGKLFFSNLPKNARSKVLHRPEMIKLASPRNEQVFRALNKALELGVVNKVIFLRKKTEEEIYSLDENHVKELKKYFEKFSSE